MNQENGLSLRFEMPNVFVLRTPTLNSVMQIIASKYRSENYLRLFQLVSTRKCKKSQAQETLSEHV